MTATEPQDEWRGPMMDGQLAAEQLDAKVGVTVTGWDPDRVTGTMPVAGNRQPYGLLHGGANAVLAESLGSTCAAVNAPSGKAAIGTELSCSHHRAATSGVVTGVATPLHVGRSAATIEIVITDESGRRTCTARLSCAYRERPPG
ncbi:MAG: hotdog fold thioesterase [Nocardioidaceae bacterium]